MLAFDILSIYRVFIGFDFVHFIGIVKIKLQRINVFVEISHSRVFKSFDVPAQSSFFITLHIHNHILSIYYYQTHSDQLTHFVHRLS